MSNIITAIGNETVTIQNNDDTPLLTVEVDSNSVDGIASADYQLPIRPVSGSHVIVEYGTNGNTRSLIVDSHTLKLVPSQISHSSSTLKYTCYTSPRITYNNETYSVTIEHRCYVTKGSIENVPVEDKTATIKSIQYIPGTTIASIVYNNKIIIT